MRDRYYVCDVWANLAHGGDIFQHAQHILKYFNMSHFHNVQRLSAQVFQTMIINESSIRQEKLITR